MGILRERKELICETDPNLNIVARMIAELVLEQTKKACVNIVKTDDITKHDYMEVHIGDEKQYPTGSLIIVTLDEYNSYQVTLDELLYWLQGFTIADIYYEEA